MQIFTTFRRGLLRGLILAVCVGGPTMLCAATPPPSDTIIHSADDTVQATDPTRRLTGPRHKNRKRRATGVSRISSRVRVYPTGPGWKNRQRAGRRVVTRSRWKR